MGLLSVILELIWICSYKWQAFILEKKKGQSLKCSLEFAVNVFDGGFVCFRIPMETLFYMMLVVEKKKDIIEGLINFPSIDFTLTSTNDTCIIEKRYIELHTLNI